MSSGKSRIPRKLKKKYVYDRYEDGTIAIIRMKRRGENGKIKERNT